ncbi:hypothetical protein HU200_010397 [Digitaria exilis]|uniref:cytokinin riboside 5'-monophosphate phosphoribohydrolase n=1 Tax=Digitaria exilis TaxID=1010633 RepID=A0A835FK96_9POAL|nr:hypothetical protein HU200_010397 [Digitaria exilis]
MEGAAESGGGGEGKQGPSSSRFRRVCVFCGSSSGKRSSYRDAAVELGKELRHTDDTDGQGGKKESRTAASFVLRYPPRSRLVALTVCARVAHADHRRDGGRGGYGTLDELLEVIAWAQLGIHSKPVSRHSALLHVSCCLHGRMNQGENTHIWLQVGLLNVDGYYNFLLAFIDKAVDDGFIKPAQRHIFVSAPDARALVQKLEEYEAVADDDPATPKLRWEIEQVGYNASLLAEIAR